MFDGSPGTLRFAKQGERPWRISRPGAQPNCCLPNTRPTCGSKPLGLPQAPATIADAYDIQQKYVPLLGGEHGDAVGYKVGLTSAAMQAFCGIDHPIAGVVLRKTPASIGSDRPAFGFRATGPGI